jgi:ribosomal protein S18 acetylase RimI-like enzyme
MPDIRIDILESTPSTCTMLATMLVEAVAAGASVSFMHPLAPQEALAFWQGSLAAAARGERVLLGAWDGALLVGTVSVLLDCPPNQPHRAEIAKLMTRLSHRRRGVAAALLRRAEQVAGARGKTLLVLDTASDGGAAALYQGLGYTLAGEIPDYALKPYGGLTGTLICWKRIAA